MTGVCCLTIIIYCYELIVSKSSDMNLADCTDGHLLIGMVRTIVADDRFGIIAWTAESSHIGISGQVLIIFITIRFIMVTSNIGRIGPGLAPANLLTVSVAKGLQRFGANIQLLITGKPGTLNSQSLFDFKEKPD